MLYRIVMPEELEEELERILTDYCADKSPDDDFDDDDWLRYFAENASKEMLEYQARRSKMHDEDEDEQYGCRG